VLKKAIFAAAVAAEPERWLTASVYGLISLAPAAGGEAGA